MKITYGTVDQFEGWDKAPKALEAFVASHGSRAILEIGAGANPTLPVEFVESRGLRYTTNDISQEELDKADPIYQRLHHDFSENHPPAEIHGAFDLVFSRMVNEHVRDGESYYRNIAAVLQPGGMTMHWFSTLYAFPFVVNRLTPEFVSKLLLRVFLPRDEFKHGKFKAYYSWGRGPTRAMIRRFEALGFEVVEYAGYFGHPYYHRKIPLLHALEMKKADWLVAHPNPLLTSYARLILRKRAAT
jgi:SAM-dependent methyltransferase